VDTFLGRSFAKRKELETQINADLRKNKIDGSLLLSVTFFKPWEYREEHEYEVIGRDAELFHLSSVSPIVKQLQETNRRSVKLYAYLILNTEIHNLSLANQQDILKSNRGKSKKILAKNLVNWVRNEFSKGAKK
jgi:HD superfamily phosphohydrolase